MKVGVVGLGKLGLPLAISLAEVGYEVVGIDKNINIIQQLRNKDFYTHEPEVMDLLSNKQICSLLKYSDNYSDLNEVDVVYIIVPTPSDSNGKFDSTLVTQSIEELIPVWSNSNKSRVIVVVSTVMPGTCDLISKKLLESTPHRLIYSPEFIALGTVIQNLKHPDSVLVGCKLVEDANEHIEIQSKITGGAQTSILTWTEAEVVKLLVNCYVTMKISFANFIAEISDVIPGTNANRISSALGMDTRIGSKYLRPGLGFSGPCFPRDVRALISWARDLKLNPDLAIATQEINARQPINWCKRIQSTVKSHARILIIGIVYKPRTEIVDESQSLMLAKELLRLGFQVYLLDPYLNPNSREILRREFEFDDELDDLKLYDLLVVTPGFEEISMPIRNRASEILSVNW